jgi:hypothetical protein
MAKDVVSLSVAPLRALRLMGELNGYLFNRSVEAGAIPSMQLAFAMQKDVMDLSLATISGKKKPWVGADELRSRMRSGARYGRLVQEMGGKLFGSARFRDEQVLRQNEYLELCYLPPDPNVAPAAFSLFHVGGFLPYSDRIFRFLPEANLFSAFLSRGVGVYALQLKKEGRALPCMREITIERLIDDIATHARLAFEHQRERGIENKMVIEGYCGLAMPMLSYLAAKPEHADEHFAVAATMVAPIDARQCVLLSDFLDHVPPSMGTYHRFISQQLFGYVRGTAVQSGMDIPLGSFWPKTRMGRFSTGWRKPQYATIEKIDQLDWRQRRELAGAYWIAPENSRRFPMPVDLITMYTRLFRRGVTDDLELPARYAKEPLSLATIRDQTQIRLVGFYGGQDPVVPQTTADVLQRAFGERYRHICHQDAGHISYVLSPERWKKGTPKAFDPNPIDVIDELHRTRPQPKRPQPKRPTNKQRQSGKKD